LILTLQELQRWYSMGVTLNRYRIAPFVRLINESDSLVLISPDNIVEIELTASDLIQSLYQNWVETHSTDVHELYKLGVLVIDTEMNSHIETLYRLEQYFMDEGLNVRVTRKGATEEYAQIMLYGYFVDSSKDEAIGFGMD